MSTSILVLLRTICTQLRMYLNGLAKVAEFLKCAQLNASSLVKSFYEPMMTVYFVNIMTNLGNSYIFADPFLTPEIVCSYSQTLPIIIIKYLNLMLSNQSLKVQIERSKEYSDFTHLRSGVPRRLGL